MRPNTQRLAVFLNRCLESCHSQANLTWRSAGAQDGYISAFYKHEDFYRTPCSVV